MLVPEADDVAQLVYYDAKLVTVFADRNSLRSVSALPDEGTTATGTFCEDDIIQMFVRPFHELDARVVFPVTHGLLEESTMISAKIALDLVWNDSQVPESLSSGSGCTCGPLALSRS